MRLLAAGVVGGVEWNAELMVPGWVSAWCVVVVGVFFWGGKLGEKCIFLRKSVFLGLTCFVGWCNLVLHSPCRR